MQGAAMRGASWELEEACSDGQVEGREQRCRRGRAEAGQICIKLSRRSRVKCS